MITTHIQTICFVSNIKIELPSQLKDFNSIQAPVTSTESFVFTIECFKKSIGSISLFGLKLVLSVSIILFISLFVINILLDSR